MPGYQPLVYREQGGSRLVTASGGSLDVESGGEIDVESGGKLEIAGTAFITTGAKVDLSSGRAWVLSNIYTTGSVLANGGVTSTGAGTFNSVTSTGTGTFNAVTSTGTGTFNAVTSTGTGTFNAVTSTGAGTFNSVSSTGNIAGAVLQADGGLKDAVETITSTDPVALKGYGISIISASGLTTDIRHTIAPITGTRKTIIVTASVTSAAVEVLTTGTWDGTNTVLRVSTTSGATEVRREFVASTTARWRPLFVDASTNWALS